MDKSLAVLCGVISTSIKIEMGKGCIESGGRCYLSRLNASLAGRVFGAHTIFQNSEAEAVVRFWSSGEAESVWGSLFGDIPVGIWILHDLEIQGPSFVIT